MAVIILCASCLGSKNNTQTLKEDVVTKERTSEPKISDRAKRFLQNLKFYLHQQEETRKEEDQRIAISEKERLIQNTLNQTLAMLLSCDVKKDANRIQELISDLKDIGEPSITALENMLTEDRPAHQRVLLVMALGAFSTEKSSDAIYKEAINSPNREVQEAAQQALKKNNSKDVLARKTIKELKTLGRASSGESTREKQMRAIGILGSLGGDAAIGELEYILRSSDDIQVQKQSLIALGEIGGDYVRSILEDNLLRSDLLSITAAIALGKMKQEDIVLYLGELLLSKDVGDNIKVAAVEGLGADNQKLARTILLNLLKDTSLSSPIHKKAVNALRLGFNDHPRGEVSSYVPLFEATAVDYVPQLLQPLLALGGDEVVGMLASRYRYFTDTKKIHALRALGRARSQKAFDTLLYIIKQESSPNLRIEVISAMRMFDDKKFKETTAKLLNQMIITADDKRERLTALNYLGDLSPADAAGIAEEWLTNSLDQETIISSINILKSHGDAKSRNALLAFKMRNNTVELNNKIEEAIAIIDARGNK